MQQKTKQTRNNLYTNILALIANVLIGIYYTPFLVKSLGLAAYGVLPLALIINQYIGVATQTLTHSYTRFYSVAIQKGDFEEASKDISSSFVVVLLICLILIPIGLLIVFYADNLFTIPGNLIKSTQILFCFTVFSFLLSLFASLLNVTLYALNRLDLMNVLKIIRVVFKFFLVIVFFTTISIDVSYVGLSNLLAEFLVLLISIVLFFRFKPSKVKIQFKYFDKSILYSILGMSVWLFIQICGDTFLYRTDNLILNHYWGTVASGALGAISEIGNYVSVVVSVLGSLFGPLILIEYAKNNHEEVKSLFLEQSTIVGCLSAILTGLIVGCGKTILDVWLSPGMSVYQWWLLMKMVVLPFYAAGGIMAFVYRSWNRMKFPAIGTLTLGLLDVTILIILCEFFKPSNPIIVLILGAAFSISQCFILNAYSVSRIYKDCRSKFLPITIKIMSTFIICSLCGRIAITIIQVQNLVTLGITMVILAIILLAFVYLVILNKNEKNKLKSIIK